MTDNDHKLDLMPGMVEAGLDVLELNTDVVNESDDATLWKTTVAEIYRAMEMSRLGQLSAYRKRAAGLDADSPVSHETRKEISAQTYIKAKKILSKQRDLLRQRIRDSGQDLSQIDLEILTIDADERMRLLNEAESELAET